MHLHIEPDIRKAYTLPSAVVQQVQKGIQSRLYKRGRFSPSMEQGVHHFHRLISEFLM